MNPLNSGFRFITLTKKVDATAVLALEREEMIDLLLVSHWEQQDRGSGHLLRLEPGRVKGTRRIPQTNIDADDAIRAYRENPKFYTRLQN